MASKHAKRQSSEARETLIQYGVKTAAAGLVAGAGGNISCRDGDIIWMKPSGFAMAELIPDDLCGLDAITGRQVAGPHKPTSEVNMHLAIYRVRPDVNAVFHTHSPWACGVISAGVTLKPMFAEFVNDLGRVGAAPYVTPTTMRLARVIERLAKRFDTIFMVNHGILAVGASIKQAFYRCVVVEDAAKSFVAARIAGRPRFLNKRQIAELMALDAARHRTKMMEQSG